MHYIQYYLRCWTTQLSLKHNKSQIADDILHTLHVASPPSTADPVIQIQFTDNTAFQFDSSARQVWAVRMSTMMCYNSCCAF